MKLNSPIKIVFVLPTLTAGGSERIISFLAQNIDKNKFDASLIIIGSSKDAVYEINNIDYRFLEKPRVLSSIPLLYKLFREIKPNIVLSVISHLNTAIAYLSIFFPKTKFVARESTVLSVDNEIFKERNNKIILNYFAKRRFNFFDKIICQSEDMLNDLKENCNLSDNKVIVINNPITNNFKRKDRITSKGPIRLITIARLSKEKGVPRILSILSKLTIPFHYTLIGDGPEKEQIMYLIKEYNLEKKITYIPYTKDINNQLINNDLFIQGSLVEGFPNALLESCVVGTPVIAYNVPGGTKEIITNGVNGFLVNTELEFIEKIQTKINWNPNKISDSVIKKFNKDVIIKDYENLFFDVLNINSN